MGYSLMQSDGTILTRQDKTRQDKTRPLVAVFLAYLLSV